MQSTHVSNIDPLFARLGFFFFFFQLQASLEGDLEDNARRAEICLPHGVPPDFLRMPVFTAQLSTE